MAAITNGEKPAIRMFTTIARIICEDSLMPNDTNELQGAEREEWESFLDSEEEFTDWLNDLIQQAIHDDKLKQEHNHANR